MAENNRRRTRGKLKAPRNNIRRTGNIKFDDEIRNARKTFNKLKKASNRDYMAKTLKAGADEFNNTQVKPTKGGKAAFTGEVAKFNKNRLIRGSAKGVRNLKGASSALMIAGEAAGRSGMLGKKVKASYKEEDRRKSELNKIADSKIKTAKKFLKGNRSSAPKGPNRTQRRKRK